MPLAAFGRVIDAKVGRRAPAFACDSALRTHTSTTPRRRSRVQPLRGDGNGGPGSVFSWSRWVATTTSATLDEAGTYTFRPTATVGLMPTSDDFVVTVVPGYLEPVVSASADVSITLKVRGVGVASRENPAIAVKKWQHDMITAAQRLAGLHIEANLKAMDGEINIAENALIAVAAGVWPHVVLICQGLSLAHRERIIAMRQAGVPTW